ncbi:hypothetical protein [Pedobacter sp. Hv1]|uniref:hypothetical protein n=1 Tax=Pedobacter sp. Hv1 TaxID=1740090 RepID=UPI0006D8B707|nr:hypothetical protein [Pedobacter sp. Hv1]KQC01773.1 hypothetical protein AQF98_05240 [Pedobacter sp. Hv1]
MNANYKNFYRNFYLQTGGFLPTKPLNQQVYPGDFFQIRNGEMIILGNIFRNNTVDPDSCQIDYNVKLNPIGWKFHDGVTKPYTSRERGHDSEEGAYEYSKQLISFGATGSFLFKANEPESIKIMNWGSIKDLLIIRLTQTHFSFREIYVVTESVSTLDWTLAISSDHKAELEIITDTEGPGLIDVFGHHSSKTILSKDLEYYHRETNRKPSFFKAKKLMVQDERLEVFISELIAQRQFQNEWARSFYKHEFHYDNEYAPQIQSHAQVSVLDMLQANELNPNTALQYFRWADANLDDIEKLFISYGN